VGKLETVYKIHCLSKEEEQGADGHVSRSAETDWEKRWIKAAQQGDIQAFERIVLTYQHKVFNLAYRFLGEREEAEDLTQEVFINVFRHLNRFRGKSQFSTWVYQVTMNHCRNRLKYLKRRHHHGTESLDTPLRTAEGELERELPDEADVPDQVLHRQEVQSLVQAALSELREDYREVIVLRDIQELSYQEVSEVLDLPEGTIKSRLHRARLELKDILLGLGVGRG
jgi:RNA polymerase sigma-70 factor (ECF subfamily)